MLRRPATGAATVERMLTSTGARRPRPAGIHAKLWMRVAVASVLVLGVEFASVAVVFAIANYAGRDRPSDEGFDSLGRALMAFFIGGAVSIVVAVIAATYAARIVRCRTTKTAGLLTIVAQFAVPIVLAVVRAPTQLIWFGALAAGPALMWFFARAATDGPNTQS